jgi:mono/diheme cytochrome c family protein
MRMQVMFSGLVVLAIGALGAVAAGQDGAKAKKAPTAAEAKALKSFEQVCQPCHGPRGDSPMPTMSLADGEWSHGSSTREIARTIAEGVPGTAMLPNKGRFTPEEILELAKLVRSFDPTLKPEKAPDK